MSKKRRYKDTFIEYGFVSLSVDGEDRPQCVVCEKVLVNDSLKPNKLRQHLGNVHSQLKDKDRSYFEEQGRALKEGRLDRPCSASGDTLSCESGALVSRPKIKAVEASYAVAMEIARQKLPHNIGENLIMPCALKMVEIVLGKESTRKLAAISLSQNTVQQRITDMVCDIKNQVLQEIKSTAFGLFSIKLVESTDLVSWPQLMVFVRYSLAGAFKDEFLFSSPMERTTTATDILEIISSVFEAHDIKWKNLCGCYIDAGSVLCSSKSDFHSLVKDLAPEVKFTHCMTNRHALAKETLPPSLKTVLDQMIQIVSFLKTTGLNTRILKRFTEEMNAEDQVFLYHTDVRWLSKGNIIQRVFELREELKSFCQENGRMNFVSWLNDKEWILRVAYLADIFEHLNELIQQAQGETTNIIKIVDSLNAFQSKLKHWNIKLKTKNVEMFQRLDFLLQLNSDHQLPALDLEQEIVQHLTALEGMVDAYFPDANEYELEMVRDPFRLAISKVAADCQEEFVALQNDSIAKDMWNNESDITFWLMLSDSYPRVTRIAIKALLPYGSPNLCESGYSTLLLLKLRQNRNKKDYESDLRWALSCTPPRIELLCH